MTTTVRFTILGLLGTTFEVVLTNQETLEELKEKLCRAISNAPDPDFLRSCQISDSNQLCPLFVTWPPNPGQIKMVLSHGTPVKDHQVFDPSVPVFVLFKTTKEVLAGSGTPRSQAPPSSSVVPNVPVAPKATSNPSSVVSPIPLLLPKDLVIAKSDAKAELRVLLRTLKYSCQEGLKNVDGSNVPVEIYHKKDTGQSSFVLNTQALSFLEKINEPFAVVSITGPARTGKSTFLTHVLHHLTGQDVGLFECSNAALSCTMGIWMWPELISWTDANGTKRKILLLDIEGLGSVDSFTDERKGSNHDYYHQLFAFGCMISSLVIFNSRSISTSFCEGSWRELSDLAGALSIFSKSEDGAVNWQSNSPHFLYLARDHNSYKTVAEDKKFWKDALSNASMNRLWKKPNSPEKQELSSLFSETFEHNSFLSLMDITGDVQKDKFDLHKLAKHEQNPRFQQKLQEFFENEFSGILENLKITNCQESFSAEEQVSSNFDQILICFLNIVSGHQLTPQTMGPLIKLTREGQIKALFASELKRLREWIRTRIPPFPWSKFEEEFNKEKVSIFSNLQESSYTKGLDESIYSIEDIESALKQEIDELQIRNRMLIQEALNELIRTKEAEYINLTGNADVPGWMQQINIPPQLTDFREEILEKLDELHRSTLLKFQELKDRCLTNGMRKLASNAGLSLTSFASEKECLDFVSSDSTISVEQLDSVLNFDIASLTKESDQEASKKAPGIRIPAWMVREDPQVFSHDFAKLAKDAATHRKGIISYVLLEQFANQSLVPTFFPSLSISFEDFNLAVFKNWIVEKFDLNFNWLDLSNQISKIEAVTFDAEKISPKVFETLKELQTSLVHLLSTLISSDCKFILRFPIEKNVNGESRIRTFLRLSQCLEEDLIGSKQLAMTDEEVSFVCFASTATIQKLIKVDLLPGWVIVVDKPVLVVMKGSESISLQRVIDFCSAYGLPLNSKPKFFENFALLSVDPKYSAKAQQLLGALAFGFTFETPIEFSEVDAAYLEANAKLIISTTRHGARFTAVLWPADSVDKTPQKKADSQMPGVKEDSKSQSMTDSPSKPRIKAGTKSQAQMGGIWQEFPDFLEDRLNTIAKIADLSLTIGKLKGNTLWNAENFGLLYDHFKGQADPKTLWCDPGLCALRVIVGAQTENISKLGFYHLDRETKISIKPPQTTRRIEFEPLSPELQASRLESTRVQVISCDSFEATIPHINEGKKVLVLNLANAGTPGGGWVNGKLAQEEDLFRRSNLSATLKLKPSLYPIPEYGVLWSPNVTVFRGTLDKGYPLLEDPYIVDVVSACAYDLGGVGLSSFNLGYTTRTFRKILSILQFAASKKYDHVVLGAIGCGAFKNPPEDIAQIFHEALQQYAGLIPEISFAVLGDPNFSIFERVIQKEYKANAFSTKNPVWGSSFKYMCPDGALCQTRGTPEHAEYFHPAECSEWDHCKDSPFHQILAVHLIPCRLGANCEKYGNELHEKIYGHPPKCNCDSGNPDHLQERWHPPICPQGLGCPIYKKKNDTTHLTVFRHRESACHVGCRRFREDNHKHNHSHPFLPPCPDLNCCESEKPSHLKQFSHRCEAGESCHRKDNPKHVRLFYHFLNHPCPLGDNCTEKLNEDHLNAYSHPGISDIRIPCKQRENCSKRTQMSHVTKYSHPAPQLKGISPVNPLSVEVTYSGSDQMKKEESPTLNQGRITFFDNVTKGIAEVSQHLQSKGQVLSKKNPNAKLIANYFRNHRPIHRCNSEIFTSVLKTGALLSTHQMKNMTPDAIYPLIASHPNMAKILKEHPGSAITRFIHIVIEITKAAHNTNTGANPTQLESLQSAHEQQKEILDTNFGGSTSEEVQSLTKSITQCLLGIQLKGLQYNIDGLIGTDRTVFSIFGPSKGKQYGPIYFILNPIIKWHPNFYVCPHAATYFYDVNRKHSAKDVRPWGKDWGPSEWAKEGQDYFQSMKFHPICPQTEDFFAYDFMTRVAERKQKPWANVTLKEVQEFWEGEESHRVLESHLPYQVPLSQVEAVVIPKEVWYKFTADEQKLAKMIFPRYHLVENDDEAYQCAQELSTRTIVENFSGFCFTLPPNPKASVTGQETFMPLRIARFQGKAYVAFEAVGFGFVLTLCDKEKLSDRNGSISIVFGPDHQVSISPHSAVKARTDKHALKAQFNAGLSPTERISYMITLDSTENKLILSHYGASELYCLEPPIEFNLDKTSAIFALDSLRFFSLHTFGELPTDFYNIRTLLEPIPSVLKVPDVVPDRSQPQDDKSWISWVEGLMTSAFGSVISPTPQPGPRKHVRVMDFGETEEPEKPPQPEQPNPAPEASKTPKKSCSKADSTTKTPKKVPTGLPTCKDDMRCVFHSRNPNEDVVKEHFAKSRHRCLYGESCTRINNPQHTSYHLKAPICKNPENCTQKKDREHRQSFCHPGLWDFMLPCRNGLSCPDINSTDHSLKYFHEGSTWFSPI